MFSLAKWLLTPPTPQIIPAARAKRRATRAGALPYARRRPNPCELFGKTIPGLGRRALPLADVYFCHKLAA